MRHVQIQFAGMKGDNPSNWGINVGQVEIAASGWDAR